MLIPLAIHVTWGTPVQSFVFLCLLVFELEPMYATSDRRTDADDRLMPPPPPLRGGGIIIVQPFIVTIIIIIVDVIIIIIIIVIQVNWESCKKKGIQYNISGITVYWLTFSVSFCRFYSYSCSFVFINLKQEHRANIY